MVVVMVEMVEVTDRKTYISSLTINNDNRFVYYVVTVTENNFFSIVRSKFKY